MSADRKPTRAHRNAFATLRFRDFRLLWAGQLASWVGTTINSVAVGWQVYELTSSAVELGLVALARTVPFLALSVPGGAAADVIDRRRLLLVTQAILMGLALVFAVTTFTDTIGMPLIYVLAILSGALTAFETPARQSMAPNLVPRQELTGAMTMMSVLRQAATIAGPGFGGLLIGVAGLWPTYGVNTLAFAISVVSILMMGRVPQVMSTGSRRTWGMVLGGFAFARREPVVLGLLVLDFSVVFFAGARGILPVYARDILDVGPEGLGLLHGAPAAGALAGAAVLSTRATISHQYLVIMVCSVAFGVFTVAFAYSTWFPLSLLLLFLTGLSDVIAEVLRATIIQLRTPDSVRGRLTALQMIFTQGGPRLSEVKVGVLAGGIGPVAAVALGGVLCIVATAVIGLQPRLRRMVDEPALAEGAAPVRTDAGR